jgi:DNA-binding MarR family transcriptional regulator
MQETPPSLHSLVHQLAAVYARESDQVLLEQYGIGFSQFKIMEALQDKPWALQKQIAFRLGQTEASISRQVKLLIRKGMIEVRQNPQNKREHLTSLTPKGARMIDAATETLSAYQERSLAHMPPKQQEQLQELLLKLHS